MTSSYTRRGKPDFRLALDGWQKRTIFGNLSCLIRGTCSSHLNLLSIIALDSGIEPHFSYSRLFEIQSVSRVPRTIHRQFLWKTSSKSPSTFRGTHTSEPCLTTVITVASNILILVCRHIFLFFQTCFNFKTALSLGYSTFTIFTAPTIFTNDTTKVSEAANPINLLVTQRHLLHLRLFLALLTYHS